MIPRCKQERSKIPRKKPVDIEYENNKQKTQLLITERNDIRPLLGMDWLKKFRLTIGIIRLDENSQSEKRQIVEKFSDLVRKNTTIKDAEMNIQLKPGHYPVKSKTNPSPFTRSSRKRNWKFNEIRAFIKSKTSGWRLFCVTGSNNDKER